MRFDIKVQSNTQFDIVARTGAMVLGRLEADFVVDLLPWEGAGNVGRFWIGNVHVEQAYRRQGIGRALVRIAMTEGAKRFGVAYVYARICPFDGLSEAEVRAFHAAVNLHQVGEHNAGRTSTPITRAPVT